MATRRQTLRGALATAAAFPRPLSGGPAAASVDPTWSGLAPLLARNRERHTGGAQGANHASMALLALAALGGGPSQLSSYGEIMLRKGRPFPEGPPSLPAGGWRAALGDLNALPGLRRYFEREIRVHGIPATLRRHLPALIPGLASAEFHCMIRTAYGVRFGEPGEVAMGLAYWSAAYQPLGMLGAPGAVSDPMACLADVRARFSPLLTEPLRGGKAAALLSASRLPGFSAAASTLAIDERSLAAIAATMVGLYRVPGRDLLHTVTGTHAYRILEPHLVDRAVGRRYLWQALVAYYLSEGAPELAAAPAAGSLPSWDEILSVARTSNDDHGLKLTHTALEEHRRYRDRRYQEVAARRWRMI